MFKFAGNYMFQTYALPEVVDIISKHDVIPFSYSIALSQIVYSFCPLLLTFQGNCTFSRHMCKCSSSSRFLHPPYYIVVVYRLFLV